MIEIKSNSNIVHAWEHRRWVLSRIAQQSLLSTPSTLAAAPSPSTASDAGQTSSSQRTATAMETLVAQEESFAVEAIRRNFSNYSAWHHRSKFIFSFPSVPSAHRHQTPMQTVTPISAPSGSPSDACSSCPCPLSVLLTEESLREHTGQTGQTEETEQREVKLYLPRCPSTQLWQSLLVSEFAQLENAFYTDPRDQTAWIYYLWLLSFGLFSVIYSLIHLFTYLLSAIISCLRSILYFQFSKFPTSWEDYISLFLCFLFSHSFCHHFFLRAPCPWFKTFVCEYAHLLHCSNLFLPIEREL